MKIQKIRKNREKIEEILLSQNLDKKELRYFIIKFFSSFVIKQELTDAEFVVLEKLMEYNDDGIDLNSSELVKKLMDDLGYKKRKTVYDLRSRLVEKFCLNKKEGLYYFPTVLDVKNYNNFKIEINSVFGHDN